MPIEVTPLFRRDVLHLRLKAFELPEHSIAGRAKLQEWAKLLSSESGLRYKETELLPDWLTDVFGRVLGYTGPTALSTEGRYTISREKLVQVENEFADAVLGDFREGDAQFVAALEGKGPLDPLDRPHAGRRQSAVDQAYRYAINLPCDWIVVTNLREIRLYYKGAPQRTYERFAIADLANDDQEFRRFVFLFGAERVVPREGRCHWYALLEASERADEQVTQEYYFEYARIRREILAKLIEANPTISPGTILSAAQRLLDRTLFIAFAEDRGLLPPGTLEKAYRHRDPYHPRPIWANFQGLFRAIDEGSETLGVPRYNGGLFAVDEVLDRQLTVSDEVCERLKRIGDFNYGSPGAPDVGTPIVDVEILGHIFEQSIEDLEVLRAELEGGIASRQTSKRKRTGAFYTPRSVTSYIVREALQPILAERFERLRREHQKKAKGTQKQVLEDPRAYNVAALNGPQREALILFWEAWIEELKMIRILDPACGSGAFLVEVFDQMHEEYTAALDRLVDLRGGARSLFDPDRTILQHNIYGVDLNAEAVEIARLSIWIKTAQRGKILTDLDHNIRVGNSIIADPTLDPHALNWQEAFPEVFAQGGFDVIVGNPPYVRAEMLTGLKEYLEKHYGVYHGQADLYVYFHELGVRLLRPGGRLSYIVTNKWMKTGYGEPLRRLLVEKTWVESIVDLGHARQVFPDADVFPSILFIRKPDSRPAPSNLSVCVIPREQVRLDDLASQVAATGFKMSRDSLGSGQWVLEPPELERLFSKMRAAGVPLREYLASEPKYGIKTGYNEAYVISTEQRDAIVAHDPGAAEIIRPCLRGQDIKRWGMAWADLWMIVMKSSGDCRWPWSDAEEEVAERIFADTHPGLYRHFKAHEERLRARRDRGKYWWELRSCDYYDIFERPKIVHTDITWRAEFAYVEEPVYIANTAYMWPTDDLYLLGVVNSPLMWSYMWRNAQHGKDEALRIIHSFFMTIPVANPTPEIRATVEERVRRLIASTNRRHQAIRNLLDWLRLEFGIEQFGTRLAAAHEMTSDEFVAEVRKRRKGAFSSAQLARLRAEYDHTIVPLRDDLRAAAVLEREISDAVNVAYGLTEEEVHLLWRTAPPRMPISGEVNVPAQV